MARPGGIVYGARDGRDGGHGQASLDDDEAIGRKARLSTGGYLIIGFFTEAS